jgi:signal transduction histidine kinase
VLSLSSPKFDAFSPRDGSLALAIANQAAVAIENARLHERSRRAAVLEERQRHARELHDSVTQALYGISLYAEAGLRALSDADQHATTANLSDIAATTREALGEMRLLLFELRPPRLEEHGLAAALQSRLRAVEARAGLVTSFDCRGDGRLPAEAEHELYRLILEALNNVLKHAQARHVRVRLDLGGEHVKVEVCDDGSGLEPSTERHGYGLPGMRERAHRLGGTLSIQSSSESGTCVRVDVPR